MTGEYDHNTHVLVRNAAGAFWRLTVLCDMEVFSPTGLPRGLMTHANASATIRVFECVKSREVEPTICRDKSPHH